MDFDYSFFHKTLHKVRRLRFYTYPYYILRGAAEVASQDQIEIAPKVISMIENDKGKVTIFDTSSYSKQPGNKLSKLREYLGNDLPEDFLAFYRKFSEALVVTRSYPVHLWNH